MEPRGPAVGNSSIKKEGRGEMKKAPISLQDLRRRIYVKAKAEPAWRFWGLYVHVCKMETLQAAYLLAKENSGAPGIDGVTFEAIEVGGRETFLKQLCEPALANRGEAPQAPRGNRRQPAMACESARTCGTRVLAMA